MSNNTALEVTKDVFWVGSRDYDIEVFDVVMKTESGTTYNSYLIKGSEKTCLIEICKDAFYNEYIERLKSVCNVEDIDYVIVNHTEPDHSGSLHRLLKINPNMEVFGTANALKYLREITNVDFKGNNAAKVGSISLGNYNLEFIVTPFLHWPDSMMTYCKELKTLFSCDVFGSHYCTEEIFNDLIEKDFMKEYKYYYDCIMKPYKKYVLSGIDKIKDLEIENICNGHGPVLRKDIKKYMDLYVEWSQDETYKDPTVVVTYVTSYKYTKVMAEVIKMQLETKGITVKLFDMVEADRGEVLGEIYKSHGVLFGSCTILGDALPPIYELLYEMNPVIHKGKIGGAFGSYGWSGEAVPYIEARLSQLRLKVPVEGLKINFRPKADDLKECIAFADKFAESILK